MKVHYSQNTQQTKSLKSIWSIKPDVVWGGRRDKTKSYLWSAELQGHTIFVLRKSNYLLCP